MPDNTTVLVQRAPAVRLPRLRPAPQPPPRPRKNSTVLPSISRSASSTSSSVTVEHETTSRALHNQPLPLVSLKSRSRGKKPKRYAHVQAKINTGLGRALSSRLAEVNTRPLPVQSAINWFELKHDIEHDLYLRAYTKRMIFHAGTSYAAQLANLGNLVRSKVKTFLLSATGNGEHQYKIVVHLTVFPTSATGLHVASRCLWDTDTDSSLTIKMQGVDCDILIVIFMCYTDLESTSA